MEKIVINFCPTGLIPTKEQTPFVPISENDIIEQVHQAYEVGITIVHLHARNEDGTATWKKTKYSKIFEGIKKHCPELIICGSTSGRNFPEFEKRSEVIELKPDMASLTLSSVNFVNQTGINQPDMIVKLIEKMNAYNVIPELEVFDLGAINYGNYLIKKGIINNKLYWNIILGNINGLQVDLSHIGNALTNIPSDSIISLGGIGVKNQLTANSIAISTGLGVRVGIEDNIWYDEEKTKLATNLDFIKRIHTIINSQDKTYMEPAELRKKLNI